MPIIVGSGMRPGVIAVTANPGSITNATTLALDLAVPGSIPGNVFFIQAPSLEADLILQGIGHCATAGTVVARIGNISASPINPASQVFNVITL